MINLIPNEEKKKKVRDFYFRLCTTFFIVLGFAMLVASASILPAYFLSSVKEKLAKEKLELQKNEPLPAIDQKTLDKVKDLGSKLTLVEKTEADKYFISEKIINEIILEKTSDIKITKIHYEYNSIKGRSISINGTAGSRDHLLLFRRALEDNTAFKGVDLPISNFIKGSNIEFSLSLIPA